MGAVLPYFHFPTLKKCLPFLCFLLPTSISYNIYFLAVHRESLMYGCSVAVFIFVSRAKSWFILGKNCNRHLSFQRRAKRAKNWALGLKGGVHIYFQQKRIIEGRGTERIFVCQPVVLGNGSKRELSYKNKDAEAFGAKIFYCLAQQVTKEQRKKKVAPVSFHFYSNKRSETCWSSWWLALAELFPKKGFPSLLRDLLWRRRCILCHFVATLIDLGWGGRDKIGMSRLISKSAISSHRLNRTFIIREFLDNINFLFCWKILSWPNLKGVMGMLCHLWICYAI